jgi:hypothetical protein
MSITFHAAREQLDPQYGIVHRWVDGGPEVNMSNINACMVLRHLGYEEIAANGSGVIAAPELSHRCREALATIRAVPGLDTEIAPIESRSDSGCVWIECGIPAGYLTRRLVDILAAAEFAGEGTVSVS